MPNRSQNARIAADTLAVLQHGSYALPNGRDVSIQRDLEMAVHRSVLYRPGELRSVHRKAQEQIAQSPHNRTALEVTGETTLATARRLSDAGEQRVLALNFASARNPGGGFMGGSAAQEESLARSSGLYPCIAQMREYYEANKKFGSALYTNHIIYSPDVPVFKDDEGALLEPHYLLSIITAPAVNAGVVERSEPVRVGQIERVMRERIEHVLAVAAAHGHDVLILGAWGCGVFKNSPDAVARWFGDALLREGDFSRAFRHVVFAVLDRSADRSIIAPFDAEFPSVER